jgi:TPP-dependent pyruvate/acetoin dehydrogenase alpha subunit
LRQKHLKLAVEQKLPLVFIGFDEPESAHSLKRREIEASTVPTITVDGADAVAVYRVASESIAYARNGKGPTLIDCLMSRDADPVQNMAAYLAAKGLKPARSRRP